MSFAISTIGVEKLRTSMRQRTNKLKNRRAVNKRAVVQVDAWVQKNFRSEGDLAHPGSGWKPLKESTKKSRRGIAPYKILQDTGQLRSRWKHYSDNDTALIQSGVDYGGYHQKGSGKLPQRRILPTREQILPILKVLYKQFVKLSIG